ncbi:MAG TPA: cytochrome c [Burkholderiales bacterium]|jgi:cytochrome c556|nr:cytochrome c [Burkholderiales bacterium]
MKRKLLAATVVASFGAAWVVDAVAQVKPEILVKQRQAAMTLQGKYFGPLAGMAQGKLPYDANIVQRNAGYLDVLDRMPWDGFDPSTKNVKSAALPAIWNEPAKFKEAQERLQSEVSRLVSVSKGGDEGAVKAQIGAVGKACGNCHENFREKQ